METVTVRASCGCEGHKLLDIPIDENGYVELAQKFCVKCLKLIELKIHEEDNPSLKK